MRDPAHLKALIEVEIQRLTDARAAAAIRARLIDPVGVMLDWDYGAPGQQFPGWVVFSDPPTQTEIVFCVEGFGPSRPWGLIMPQGDQRFMGMDSSWFQSLTDAWLDTWVAADLERGAPLGHGPADA